MIAAINKHSKTSYQTPVWNTESSNQANQENPSPHIVPSKHKSQASILDRIRASKNINLQDIDISHKVSNKAKNQNLGDEYFPIHFSQFQPQQTVMKNKSNINDLEVRESNKEKIKTNFQVASSKKGKEKENVTYTPARSKLFNPKQSRTEKATPQKSSKIPFRSSSRRIPRQPLTQLSVHQQLYLDSRKKQIKKSTQLIIQNEYFKKKHPFKPTIGQVSQFLAQERYEKIRDRQNFQKQFEQFSDWKQSRLLAKSISKSTIKSHKDHFDLKNQKQSEQKSAELKNYTMLRELFFYLTQSQQQLRFSHLTSKKLCQLPAPMLKSLEPIIETFYKNKAKHKLSWLQFLSEFNLKVNKKKMFHALIEKWFAVKFGVVFDGIKMVTSDQKNETNMRKEENSTQIGHSVLYEQDSKIQRIIRR